MVSSLLCLTTVVYNPVPATTVKLIRRKNSTESIHNNKHTKKEIPAKTETLG